jgi:hypothetical protein
MYCLKGALRPPITKEKGILVIASQDDVLWSVDIIITCIFS